MTNSDGRCAVGFNLAPSAGSLMDANRAQTQRQLAIVVLGSRSWRLLQARADGGTFRCHRQPN